ncbi:MAG: GNAT family N-acetyltransferase [Patescibacteria group bacterium]
MSSFEIRPFVAADSEYVAAVMQQRWNVSRDYALDDTQYYLKNDKDYAGFCAHYGEKTVGIGLFSIDNEAVSKKYGPWVYLLWVESEYRGHDLGIELTKKRMEHARAQGYEMLYLDTVLAAEYHRRLGWEEVETVENGGVAKIIMKYDLSKSFPSISSV